MTSLTERFIKGLQEYDLTYDEIRNGNWKYYGGNKGSHLAYYNLASKNDILPEPTDECICGHKIKYNCYITNGTHIIILGSCCIKRFIPASTRTCEVCGNPHKNRKKNKCNECRVGICEKCDKPCDPRYKNCARCVFG